MRPRDTDPLWIASNQDERFVFLDELPDNEDEGPSLFEVGLAVGVAAGGILGAAVALAVTGWFS